MSNPTRILAVSLLLLWLSGCSSMSANTMAEEPAMHPIQDVVKDDVSYVVDVYDPWVNPAEAVREYGVEPIKEPKEKSYAAVVLAVAHREFVDMGAGKLRSLCQADGVLYDIKYALPKAETDGRL